MNTRMQRLPGALTGVLAAVLGFGLVDTLVQALAVAPHARSGADGRLYHHTKNITRIGGSPDDVRSVVWRAVFLDDRDVPPPAQEWQQAITASLRPSPRPSHVVVLPADGDDALQWSLPGAYWAAYAGVPVVFVGRDGGSPDTIDALRQYQAPVYVIAPEHLVTDSYLERVRALDVPVVRVTGTDPVSHAVTLAEYRDARTGFGWGRPHAARTGYFSGSAPCGWRRAPASSSPGP